MSRIARALLEIAAAALLAGGVGLALGWLSRSVFIIGLLPLGVGLLAGAGAGFAAVVSGGTSRRGAFVAAALGVVVGWCAFQVAEDAHFVETFRQDYAAARYADSGAPATDAMAEEDVPFFAQGADEVLSKQVREETGFDGVVARWIFRAGSGVRLFGPWHASRGLPVGLPGAIVWAVAELLIALWVARAVLKRLWRLTDAEAVPLADVSRP